MSNHSRKSTVGRPEFKRAVYSTKVAQADAEHLRTILQKLITAWEALPSGYYEGYSGAIKLQDWLYDDMWPAINDAREALGQARKDRR